MTMETVGVKLEAQGEDQFVSAMDRAEKSVRGFGDATEGASGKVNVAQAALTGAFTAIANVAVEAFGRAMEAIGNFIGGSVEAAADFEQQLAVLRVTSGATAEEMAKVSDLSIQLGNDLTLPTTSAQDANDAILELVKGGLSLEDAMDAARGSLLLATAAETDAGEAAQITAGILNAFSLEGDQATRVVDLLAGAAAKGAGDIADYAQGFQQAGFAFHGARLPAEDLAASLQTLIESGLTGSDAGTALKNAIVRLQNPTKEAASLMAALGINVYDAQGQMLPFDQIIGVVNSGLAGMTDEQRNAALGTIFLSDGMKAMIPLLNQGSDAFIERRDAVSESGAAEALAAAQTEGFKGAQAALQSQLETLQLVIGQKLLPILTDLFRNVISPAISTVMSMVEAFFAAGGGADQLAAQIAPARDVFAQLMGVVEMLAPIFNQAFSAIQSIVASVAGYVQAVLGQLAAFMNKHGDEIQAFIQGAWEKISSIISLAVQLVSAVVTKVFDFLADFLNQHGDKIQAFLTAAWNAITLIINTALTLIKSIITIALAIIQGDWETVWTEIEMLVQTVWNAIGELINAALELIKATIELALTFLMKLFRDAWEKIRKGVEDDWNKITNAIKAQLDNIRNAAESVIRTIVQAFEQLPATLARIAEEAVNGLVERLMSGLATIRGAIQSILDAIGQIRLPNLGSVFNGSSYSGSSFQAPTTEQIYGSGKSALPGGNSFARNYNLTLNTAQASAGVMSDFAIMEALAGR